MASHGHPLRQSLDFFGENTPADKLDDAQNDFDFTTIQDASFDASNSINSDPLSHLDFMRGIGGGFGARGLPPFVAQTSFGVNAQLQNILPAGYQPSQSNIHIQKQLCSADVGANSNSNLFSATAPAAQRSYFQQPRTLNSNSADEQDAQGQQQDPSYGIGAYGTPDENSHFNDFINFNPAEQYDEESQESQESSLDSEPSPELPSFHEAKDLNYEAPVQSHSSPYYNIDDNEEVVVEQPAQFRSTPPYDTESGDAAAHENSDDSFHPSPPPAKKRKTARARCRTRNNNTNTTDTSDEVAAAPQQAAHTAPSAGSNGLRFSSVAEAEAIHSNRTTLNVKNDDSQEMEANPAPYVQQIMAAFQKPYISSPRGECLDTTTQTRWNGFQNVHLEKVANHIKGDDSKIEIAAWLVFGAVIEAHKHGIKNLKPASASTKKCSTRLTHAAKTIADYAIVRWDVIRGERIQDLANNHTAVITRKIANFYGNTHKKQRDEENAQAAVEEGFQYKKVLGTKRKSTGGNAATKPGRALKRARDDYEEEEPPPPTKRARATLRGMGAQMSNFVTAGPDDFS